MLVPSVELILASSSRYRQAQLAQLGIKADAIAPEIDESPLAHEQPQQMAERLATLKARKIAADHKHALVIGSDQVAVVEHDGKQQLLGKPGNFEAALAQLQMCQAKKVAFYSALCVCLGNRAVTRTDVTEVYFRSLTVESITAYLRCEQPYDCAGSFKSEGRGVLLFERIESRDPNSLIGLPVMLLRDILAQFDVDLLALATA